MKQARLVGLALRDELLERYRRGDRQVRGGSSEGSFDEWLAGFCEGYAGLEDELAEAD